MTFLRWISIQILVVLFLNFYNHELCNELVRTVERIDILRENRLLQVTKLENLHLSMLQNLIVLLLDQYELSVQKGTCLFLILRSLLLLDIIDMIIVSVSTVALLFVIIIILAELLSKSYLQSDFARLGN